MFEKEKKKFSPLKLVAFVAILAFGALAVVANGGNFFDKDRNISEGADIKGEFRQISSMGDIAVTESGGKLNFYDNTGKFMKEYALGFKNPRLTRSGKLVIASDINGKEIKVFDENGLKWNKVFKGKIKGVKGNSTGSVVVIYTGSDGKGIVKTFNQNGKLKLFDKFYRGILVDAGADADNKRFFAVTHDVLTSGLVYQIYMYNKNGEQTAMKMVNDEAYISAGFVNGSLICCDTGDVFGLQGGKVKWKNELDTTVRKVFSSEKAFAISTQASDSMINRNSTLVVYNEAGEEDFSKDIDGEIKNVETYDDGVAVCSEREVKFINYSGNTKWEHNLYKDVRDACFDGINGYILYGKGVLNIKLKKI